MILKRIGPVSAGKVMAVLYALIGLLVGAFVTLFALMGGGGTEGAGMMGMVMGVGAIIVLPILYAIIGFIAGALGAVLYNVAAGIGGGMELDLQ
jgi:hypothetical protein